MDADADAERSGLRVTDNPPRYDGLFASVWTRHLLPVLKQQRPEVNAALECIQNQFCDLTGGRDNDNKDAAADRACQSLQLDRTFFRGGDDEFLRQLRTTKQPWLRWPLVHLAPCEDPAAYEAFVDDPKQAWMLDSVRTDDKERRQLLEQAKSPEDRAWWCAPHCCEALNGLFLYALLTAAFPHGSFRRAHSINHVWIVGQLSRNHPLRSYDLYWPTVGVSDLAQHLTETQGSSSYVLVDPQLHPLLAPSRSITLKPLAQLSGSQ